MAPERSQEIAELTAPSVRQARTSLEVGRVFAADSGCRYEVKELLGQGGYAEVYRARAVKPTGVELEVALKCLRASLGDDEPDSEKLFLDEARVSLQLQEHPHIARAMDLERIDGRLFLVLEYVDGVSLKTVLAAAAERKDPMPLEFVCYVGACIADALHHANTLLGPDGEPLAIVHRDLTASNVMVTRRGIPKLLDFGIAFARLADRERTRTGVVRGTYTYLSPEQADAGRAAKGEVDGRSDLFSLGLLLAELLTGRKVFKEKDEYLTVQAIRECSPARVQEATRELPSDLQRICRRLLTRKPADRYQSGEELALELRASLLEREPLYGRRECVIDLAALGVVKLGQETGTRSTVRMRRRATARRFALVAAASLVVGAAAGALGVMVGRPTGRTASPPEVRAPERPSLKAQAAGQDGPLPVPATAAQPSLGPSQAPAPEEGKTPREPASAEAPAPSAPAAADLGWPGGSPVRKKARAPEKRGVELATAPAAATAATGEASVPPPVAMEEPKERAPKAPEHGILRKATATLPRGMVMRVRLRTSIVAVPGEVAEAVVVEDAASGSSSVPKGAVLSCRTGSVAAGRLGLSCDTARAGEREWTFSALALGEGDRAGLRLDGSDVQAGTMFTVAVTASSIAE